MNSTLSLAEAHGIVERMREKLDMMPDFPIVPKADIVQLIAAADRFSSYVARRKYIDQYKSE